MSKQDTGAMKAQIQDLMIKLARIDNTVNKLDILVTIKSPTMADLEGMLAQIQLPQVRLDRKFTQSFNDILDRFERNEGKRDIQFDKIDTRFDALDTKFDSVDSRFDALEKRQANFEFRLGAIEERIGDMDQKLDVIIRLLKKQQRAVT